MYKEPRTLDKPQASLSWCHPNVHVSTLTLNKSSNFSATESIYCL